MMAAEAKRSAVNRPHRPQQMVKCPRCNSSETKFCYYNNYSPTQPRYFCKNCKRYWTAGGTLRSVPVGGGLRKNKRRSKTLPPSSIHQLQKPSSSSTTSINASELNHSSIASHVGLLNSSPDTNHTRLPYTPNYLVFNQRNYEKDNYPGQLPLYQQEVNYNHQFVSHPPLPILAGAGLKQHEPSLSGTPYFSPYPWQPKDHESTLLESLQPGRGVRHSSEINAGSVNYTMNNLTDWQQISENYLFGSGGEGNYMFMQPAPQPAQWAEFEAGTRL